MPQPLAHAESIPVSRRPPGPCPSAAQARFRRATLSRDSASA
jgi:hypothetical protein